MSGLLLAALLLHATYSAEAKDWNTVLAITKVVHVTPSNYNHLQYLRACAFHGLGDRSRATACATSVLDGLYRPERRHEIVCEIILRDMESWRDGDFGDVDRLMTRATDDLRNRRAPIDTQREILEKLDRLIQEQEPKPQSNPDSSSDKSLPAPDSIPQTDDGKGAVTTRDYKKLQDSWGNLPDKERVKVLTEITRNVPDKYKSMVEQYYKSLGK